MRAAKFIDADIIDHPELANVYGGFGVFDTAGNGYLAVPITTPDAAERPGRRSLTEVQHAVRDALSAWSIRAFYTARAAGKSPEEADAMLRKHAATTFSADSARKKGQAACRTVFGMDPAQVAEETRRTIENAKAKGGESAVKTIVDAAFTTYGNMGRAFTRSRDYDARLYEAFHGRAPREFHEKMADAVNPRPAEAHFSLPIAAQLSFLTGVNLAFLWQDQWHYRLVLGAAAAIHPWTRNEPAELLPEQLYALVRCAETANHHDPKNEHGLVKCFLARMIDKHQGRAHFLHHARRALIDARLLPERPHTVPGLMRRAAAFVDDDGQPASFAITPR